MCVAIAAAIAYLLYRGKHPWSDTWNKALLATRFVLLFFLSFLLLGPIVKQITNLFDKPVFVLVYDNSASIRQTTDTTTRVLLEQKMTGLSEVLTEAGYDVKVSDLQGAAVTHPLFTGHQSDLGGALRRISSQYESSQIGGVLLASDGIYNEGISPLYNVYNYPVYTLGIGDTTQHPDIVIRDVAYNKIVYQGNKFPVRVEVLIKNLNVEPVRVSLMRRGKVLEQQTKTPTGDALMAFDLRRPRPAGGVQLLAEAHRGLVLCTGATGSGKSTTLAAISGTSTPPAAATSSRSKTRSSSSTTTG